MNGNIEIGPWIVSINAELAGLLLFKRVSHHTFIRVGPSKVLEFLILLDDGQDSAYSYVVAELIELLQINLLNFTQEWHVVHTDSE